MEKPKEAICFDCNKDMAIPREFSRREECTHCGADIHVCKNCRFYDSGSYNECREPTADAVQDKERANFCDYFELQRGGSGAGPGTNDLLSAAEALFKK